MAGHGETSEGFTFGDETPENTLSNSESSSIEGFTFGDETPENTPGNSEPPSIEGFTFGEEASGITTETAQDLVGARSTVERQGLQQELDFPPEGVEFFESLFDQYTPRIDAGIERINNEVDSVAELPYKQLISKPIEVTPTREFLNLGNRIQAEVDRINRLGENDEIVIQILELSPEGEELIFTTKKEAILYLYWSKLVLKETENIIQQIQAEQEASGENQAWEEGLKNHFLNNWYYYLGGYMALSTLGSMRRGVRIFFSRKLQMGNRVSTTNQNAEDPRLGVEAAEYQRRVEARDLALQIFDGNEDITQLLNKDNSIRIIDSRIEGLEETDKKGISRPNSMFAEASYWRNIRNIVRQRGVLKQGFDIIGKLYYLDSSDKVTSQLQEAFKIKEEVLQYFRGASGQQDIEKILAYLELSHDVANDVELSRRDDLTKVLDTEIKQGKIPYIFGMKTEKAIETIKLRLIQAINPNAKKADIARILGDGSHSNPGEGAKLLGEEVQENFKNISRYEDGISARQVQANILGEPYDSRQVRTNLEEFLNSIKIGREGVGENRYNFRTASLIVENILKGESVEDAITHSFGTSTDILEAKVQSRSYIANINNRIIAQLGTDLKTRVENISTPGELQGFKSQVINHIVDRDGKLKPGFEGFGQDILDLYKEAETRVNNGTTIDSEVEDVESTDDSRGEDASEEARTGEGDDTGRGTDNDERHPFGIDPDDPGIIDADYEDVTDEATRGDDPDSPRTPTGIPAPEPTTPEETTPSPSEPAETLREEIDPLELQREKRDFMYRARAEGYLRDGEADPYFISRYTSLSRDANVPTSELQDRIISDMGGDIEIRSWEDIIGDFIDKNRSIEVLFPGRLQRTFNTDRALRGIDADISAGRITGETRTQFIRDIMGRIGRAF